MKREQLETLVRTGYDELADEYVKRFFHELEQKPFDRELLDRFAEGSGAQEVCDVGCGPGHIARYLSAKGVRARGIDISEQMIRCARTEVPESRFDVGNMLELDFDDATLAGVVAFYSLIHLTREDAPRALREFHRVLRPGGRLLTATHEGAEHVHVDDMLDQPVEMYATLYGREEIAEYARAAGFEVENVRTRDPYEFEYPTTRVYTRATKPG